MTKTGWTTRLQAAGAGVLAAGAGLAAGSGLSALLTGVPNPVIAVSNRVVDWAPVWLIEFGKQTFGVDDKPILIGTVLVAVFIFGVIAGLVGLRRPTVAVALTGLLGIVALAASATDRTATASAFLVILPALLALVVSLFAIAWLLARLARRTDDEKDRWLQPHPGDELTSDFDRRRFLAAVLATGGVAAVGGTLSGVFGGSAASGSRSEVASRVRQLSPELAGPVPGGTQIQLDGISSYLTPNDDFYRIDTALTVPDVPADTWTLRVHGAVDEELELSYEDLLDMRLVERRITMTCVSNEVGGELAGNATWIGVPVADVLEMAGVRSDEADAVLATSEDGWTCMTTVADLVERQALLAVAMNGEPLPLEHGFPVRVVCPGLYGMVGSTKWLREFELTRFDSEEAYWTQRGWDQRAPIKTQSRIDTPRGFEELTPASDGSLTMGGVAWAQTVGIDKVEVQIDDEPWQEADLGTEDTVDTWRMWSFTWAEPTSGSHNITVRATDKSGATQTSDSARPLPNGATGWHNISFRVA